jgi:Carboxypeptidase regulatory-like domain
MLGVGVTSGCFHVSDKPTRKAKGRLTYSWADSALRTSKIAGRLVAMLPGKGGTPIWNLTHQIDQPIVGAAITIHDAVSRAVYKATSDQDGRFVFEGLPNGTYVIHIEGGIAGDFTYDPEDDIVRLDDSAKHDELLFKGGPSGCGGNQLDLDLYTQLVTTHGL